MLAAKNADMCSKWLITEPCVKSFIRHEASLNLPVAQQSDITSVCDFSMLNHQQSQLLQVSSTRRRLRNRRRNPCRDSFSPSDTMKDEENQPTNECNQATGNRDEHKPTHHTQLIKELAVIVSVDDARMHRPFI